VKSGDAPDVYRVRMESSCVGPMPENTAGVTDSNGSNTKGGANEQK
jgi:hypothetical protein